MEGVNNIVYLHAAVGIFRKKRMPNETWGYGREIMEEFDLFAPQTFFQPERHGGDRKGFGNGTYIMEKRSKAELRRLGMKGKTVAIGRGASCECGRKTCECMSRRGRLRLGRDSFVTKDTRSNEVIGAYQLELASKP